MSSLSTTSSYGMSNARSFLLRTIMELALLPGRRSRLASSAGYLAKRRAPGGASKISGPRTPSGKGGTRSKLMKHCARRSARNRPTFALAWLLTRPEVTAPIIGPRDMAQLEGSLRAVSLASELEPETLSRLDKIFPPYKTSPEDYAW